MRKIFKSSLFICLLIVLSSALLFAYNPPDYHYTFYGDGTGDMLLQVDDIPTHKQYAASGAASYNTTQPQTSSQYWNTCDMTGDNLCQVDDIPSLKQVASGNTISIVLASWEIVNWDLPLTGNTSGPTFIPFRLNARATGATVVGRPGIIMKVTIDPIGSTTTGLLQGRKCSSGDLHEAGASCAIAVSVTDMADPNNSVGLTESASSTTLAVEALAPGILHLHVETVAQPLLQIPAMTLDLYPHFIGCRIFVDDDASGSNNGSSWADAFTVIQDAVDAAAEGCEIWVAEGNYSTTGTASVLTMKDGVEIYGGFIGTETALSEREDPSLHPTILNGSGHIVVSGASSATLDGFTIQNGHGEGGGGITISGVTTLELANCIFHANRSYWYAGAVYIDSSSSNIEIKDCHFEENQVGAPVCDPYYNKVTPPLFGGAISSYGSSVTITRSTFINNKTIFDANCESGYVYGGAISGSNLTISDCLFEGNHSSAGGAIYAQGNSFTIINSVFSSNTVWGPPASPGKGGAIYATSNVSIVNSLFNGNKAQSPTGGSLGGAIFADGSPIITNNTFSGNSAAAGLGGTTYGGAIYVNGASSLPNIRNCILWGDSATSGPEIYNNGGTPTVMYSDVQGGYAGTSNIDSDPLFVSSTDFHLTLGSPCINAGTNTGAPAYDLDGNLRPSPVGGIVDMGAYEYQFP